MDNHEKIRLQLQRLTKSEDATVLGIVTAVNAADFTIDLIDDETGVEYFDVRLKPVLDANEFLLVIPKVGTWCLAVKIEDEQEWYMLSVGQAEKYIIKIGTQHFEMDGQKFLIKTGDDSLGEIMNDLLQAVLMMVFTTNMGPTIKLVNASDFTTIKSRLNAILK